MPGDSDGKGGSEVCGWLPYGGEPPLYRRAYVYDGDSHEAAVYALLSRRLEEEVGSTLQPEESRKSDRN